MVFQSTLESGCHLRALIPDLKESVPRPCGHCHSITRNTQAANTVIMAGQDTCAGPFEGVPHIAVEVVVAGKYEAAALRERDGGDAALDAAVG